MNLDIEKSIDEILRNSNLINLLVEIKDKESVCEFIYKNSQNISKEEIREYIEYLIDSKKEKLYLEDLCKISAGVNSKCWNKSISASLASLLAMGTISTPTSAYVHTLPQNESKINKVVGTTVGVGVTTLSVGALILINHLNNNSKIEEFKKVEKEINDVYKKVYNKKVYQNKINNYIKKINSDLSKKLKAKYKKIDIKNIEYESGLLIFNKDILKVIIKNKEYFEEDIANTDRFLNYLRESSYRAPYKGLSNREIYCYLNSAVQLLGADSEICQALRSDEKMREYFDKLQEDKESTQNELDDLYNQLKAFYQEIKNIINKNVDLSTFTGENTINNLCMNKNDITLADIITIYEALKGYHGKNPNDNNKWYEKDYLLNAEVKFNNPKMLYEIILKKIKKNDRDLLYKHINRFFEIYDESDYKVKCNLISGINEIIRQDSSYEKNIDEFKKNQETINKLTEMMNYVNDTNDSSNADMGGHELADILKDRDQKSGRNTVDWHTQNDLAVDAIIDGFKVPNFMLKYVICSCNGEKIDPKEEFKNTCQCLPFVIINGMRGIDNIGTIHPHDIDMELHEELTDALGNKYKLISFACHSGELNSGHWWTVRKDESGTWWECNDSRVFDAGNSEQCLNNNRYIKGATVLLYKKFNKLI